MKKTVYICDPDKNKDCNKLGCQVFGVCKCTTDVKYAKTGEQGRPIVAVRTDQYGDGAS